MLVSSHVAPKHRFELSAWKETFKQKLKDEFVDFPMTRPDHSGTPSSLVFSKRGAGVRVGVGMLRGRKVPLNQNVSAFERLKVSEFSSRVSWFLRFLVARCLRALVSWCQSFKVVKIEK